jgi:hypothetical protein
LSSLQVRKKWIEQAWSNFLLLSINSYNQVKPDLYKGR